MVTIDDAHAEYNKDTIILPLTLYFVGESYPDLFKYDIVLCLVKLVCNMMMSLNQIH